MKGCCAARIKINATSHYNYLCNNSNYYTRSSLHHRRGWSCDGRFLTSHGGGFGGDGVGQSCGIYISAQDNQHRHFHYSRLASPPRGYDTASPATSSSHDDYYLKHTQPYSSLSVLQNRNLPVVPSSSFLWNNYYSSSNHSVLNHGLRQTTTPDINSIFNVYRSQHFHQQQHSQQQQRYLSTSSEHQSHSQSPPNFPSTNRSQLDALQFRVNELEHIAQQFGMLNKFDSQNEVWSLLAECASGSSFKDATTSSSSLSSSTNSREMVMAIQEELISKAKLSIRLLELCLEGVEARRVFIWNWLENGTDNNNNNNMTNAQTMNETDNKSDEKFSPTSFWKEASHPTKEMYNLVFTSWKNVIESCSSSSPSSINPMDAIALMENAARQASSLLLLMEDERSSDLAFVQAYNSRVDRSKFMMLNSGAAIPDVRNYSEVLGAWGRCVGGSVFHPSKKRRDHHTSRHRPMQDRSFRENNNDNELKGMFQNRLRLEASAMKAMVELIESMEEGLYESYSDGDTAQPRNRPPPDRVCYNIILASMARQANPSLYEMRLMLQRMMERVKYELENPLYDLEGSDIHKDDKSGDETNNAEIDEDHLELLSNSRALSFFPDSFSYNALIEAHANRSAMFSSAEEIRNNHDSREKRQQKTLQESFLAKRHHSQWHQLQQEQRRRFTSSEEEAILAEQTLEEMCSLATMPIRPNVWSYNAVIKSWIKCGSERGLKRSVDVLSALALNRINKTQGKLKDKPTVLERISNWGSSLFGNEEIKRDETAQRSSNESSGENGSPRRTQNQNQFPHRLAGVGMASRLNYFQSPIGVRDGNNKGKSQPNRDRTDKRGAQIQMNQMPIGMASRMALMNSAFQNKNANRNSPTRPQHAIGSLKSSHMGKNGSNEKNKNEKSDVIGPLPYIEPLVNPNMMTFKVVIDALGRCGTQASAQSAEGLLCLLEDCTAIDSGDDFTELGMIEKEKVDSTPSIAVYNSVLNAWARTGKETKDDRVALLSAQRAETLLRNMAENGHDANGSVPPLPSVTSFFTVIDAWARASSVAASKGNISGGQTAAEHAEALLNELQAQRFEYCPITASCFGSAIKAWACLSGKSRSSGGHAARAQSVLERMVEESNACRRTRGSSDLIHFNSVLDAWVRDLATMASSNKSDNIISIISNVHAMLMKMHKGGYHQYNIEPDTSSFNHVIRACYTPWMSANKHSDNKSAQSNAMELALDTYRQMGIDNSSLNRADAHTYSHLFKAIACLIPSASSDVDNTIERINLCKTVFEACCRDGQLTKTSFWVLRKTFQDESEFIEFLLPQVSSYVEASKDKLLSIPEGNLFNLLPAEWSRNGRKYNSLNSHMQ